MLALLYKPKDILESKEAKKMVQVCLKDYSTNNKCVLTLGGRDGNGLQHEKLDQWSALPLMSSS